VDQLETVNLQQEKNKWDAQYRTDSIELATPEFAWQVFVARPPAVSQP
jgi:hypothetical protein